MVNSHFVLSSKTEKINENPNSLFFTKQSLQTIIQSLLFFMRDFGPMINLFLIKTKPFFKNQYFRYFEKIKQLFEISCVRKNTTFFSWEFFIPSLLLTVMIIAAMFSSFNDLVKSVFIISILISGIVFHLSHQEGLPIQTTMHISEEQTKPIKISVDDPSTNRLKKSNLTDFLHIFLLGIVVVLFLYFGTVHLGQFMSVDEPKWLYTRVPQLYEALRTGNWSATYINDKPGILPSLLAGITNFFLDVSDFGPHNLENYLFWWRFPILLFNFLMLFPIYFFTKDLFDRDYALLTTGLIALTPIVIGISQIVNPDATLWSVSFITFLTFFLYLKTDKQKYIWFSGLFFGLSLITKYFVAIFYVIFPIITYLEYFIGKKTRVQFLKRCLSQGQLFLISIGTYTLFFPATWSNPQQIIKGTVGANILSSGMKIFLLIALLVVFELTILKGKISQWLRTKFDVINIVSLTISSILLFFSVILLLNMLAGYVLISPEQVRFSATRANYAFVDALIYSVYVILYTLPVIQLFSLVTLPIFLLARWHTLSDIEKLTIVAALTLITAFIFGSSLGGYLAIPRYQIMLYPFYCLIAAVFFLNIIKNKKLVITVCLLSLSLIPTINAMPFYLHYNNPLNIRQTVVSEAWGFGGYELAQLMNTFPNVENITVWADREGFREFYLGKSYWRVRNNPFNYTEDIDYLILTVGGYRIFEGAAQVKSGRYYNYLKNSDGKLFWYYEKEPVAEFFINGNPNNYIRIVRFEE